jgi:hypothetical protein
MINIQKISAKIEALLNDNTINTNFKTFFWIENLDRTYEKVDGVNETFIPAVIINNTGQYRPIPELLISDQNVTIQLYYPQSRQEELLTVLEQFSSKIIGKVITIDNKPLVFNLDIPTFSELKQENIETLNIYDPRLSLKETEVYGVIQIRLYFVESNLMYGNQVKFSLKPRGTSNFEQLIKYDSSSQNNKVTATEQLLNNPTAESVVQMNSYGNSITFYFNPASTLHQNIIRDAELGINQNQVYLLKIEYGTISYLTFEKEVIIESVSISQSLGNIIMLSISFKKASVII